MGQVSYAEGRVREILRVFFYLCRSPSQLHADVSENNMVPREFKLAGDEDCSKNNNIRLKVDRLLVMDS